MIDLVQMKDGPFHGKSLSVDSSTNTLKIPQALPIKAEWDYVPQYDEWGMDTRDKFTEYIYHRIPGTAIFEWESDQPIIRDIK